MNVIATCFLSVGASLVLGVAGISSASAAPAARFTARPVQGSTCVAPCAVHFDAVGFGSRSPTPFVTAETTDPDFPREFHSMLFEWDFGDPASGYWPEGASARAGVAPSRNYDRGPVAGHLYETPGTYTVTLRVTNPNGQMSSATRTVTVADPSVVFPPSETFCFANSSSNWAGCPLDCSVDDNCTVTSDFNLAMTAGDDCSGTRDCANADQDGTRRILFRRGDTFNQSSNITMANNQGPGLIATFGSGAPPIINRNQSPVRQGGGWTWTGMNGRNGGNPGPLWTEGMDAAVGFSYINWIESDFNAAGIDEIVNDNDTRVGELHAYVNVTFSSRPNSAAYRHWPGSRYGLWLGGVVDANSGTRDGSTVRSRHMQHWVINHVSFLNAPTNREHWQFRSMDTFSGMSDAAEANAYNYVADNYLENRGDGGFFTVRLCVDSGCNCGENAAGTDCGGAGIGAGNIVDSRDFIFERNFFQYDSSGPADRLGIFEIQGGGVTIRNNVFDLQNTGLTNTNQSFVVATGQPNDHSSGSSLSGDVQVYNNTLFWDHTMSASFGLIGDRGIHGNGCPSGCIARNNLIVAPSYTGGSGSIPSVAASNNVVATVEPFLAAVPEQGSTDILDFRPRSGASGIVDSGFRGLWLFDDAAGYCRTDGAPDVGAFEVGATSCPTQPPGGGGGGGGGGGSAPLEAPVLL